jgi:hypothetical protein
MDFRRLTAWFSEHYALWTDVAFAFLVILCALILNRIIGRLLKSLVEREKAHGDIWRTA